MAEKVLRYMDEKLRHKVFLHALGPWTINASVNIAHNHRVYMGVCMHSAFQFHLLDCELI